MEQCKVVNVSIINQLFSTTRGKCSSNSQFNNSILHNISDQNLFIFFVFSLIETKVIPSLRQFPIRLSKDRCSIIGDSSEWRSINRDNSIIIGTAVAQAASLWTVVLPLRTTAVSLGTVVVSLGTVALLMGTMALLSSPT